MLFVANLGSSILKNKTVAVWPFTYYLTKHPVKESKVFCILLGK